VALTTAAAALLGLGLLSSIGLGLLSSTTSPRHSKTLDNERRRFDELSADERERMFGAAIPVPMEIFDFYRRNMRRDDRFYVQAPAEAFGEFADTLPAIEVARPEDATVVVSYDSDPGLLPLTYSEQIRAGLQLIFVSRVRR
jgi:hypothetical protein